MKSVLKSMPHATTSATNPYFKYMSAFGMLTKATKAVSEQMRSRRDEAISKQSVK